MFLLVSEQVSPATREEIRQTYNAMLELLRHFWACFPVMSKALEDKVFEYHRKLKNLVLKFTVIKHLFLYVATQYSQVYPANNHDFHISLGKALSHYFTCLTILLI